MLKEARNQKLITRINKLLQKYTISEDITYSLQEKDGIYQCVIKYQKDGVWDSLWASTGLKKERGNIRQAKKEAEEIADIFKATVKDKISNNEEKEISISNFQVLAELNTTNYNPKKKQRLIGISMNIWNIGYIKSLKNLLNKILLMDMKEMLLKE